LLDELDIDRGLKEASVTGDEISKALQELFEEAPELEHGSVSLQEARAWIDEMYRELRIVSENPIKNLLHLILRLQTTRRQLEVSDRIKVSIPLELTESRVVIHDWHKARQKDEQTWPRAVILSRDPNEADFGYIPIESIDIIQSVRKDPAAVRHFAIQIAIHRWANLVRYYYHLPVLSDDTEAQRKRGVRSQHMWYKIAANNLQRVGGQAILEQAQKDALPMEVAVVAHNTELYRQEQYLPVVWELLSKPEIQAKNSDLELLKALRDGLEARRDSFPSVNCGSLPGDVTGTQRFKIKVGILEINCQPGKPLPMVAQADHIFEFLQSSQGRRFQRSPGQLHNVQRQFRAWYLQREPDTVDRYFKKAKMKIPRTVAEYSFNRERWLHPTLWNSYSLSEFVDWDSPFNWFTPPTVTANDK
jgi:hypothetical protein